MQGWEAKAHCGVGAGRGQTPVQPAEEGLGLLHQRAPARGQQQARRRASASALKAQRLPVADIPPGSSQSSEEQAGTRAFVNMASWAKARKGPGTSRQRASSPGGAHRGHVRTLTCASAHACAFVRAPGAHMHTHGHIAYSANLSRCASPICEHAHTDTHVRTSAHRVCVGNKDTSRQLTQCQMVFIQK